MCAVSNSPALCVSWAPTQSRPSYDPSGESQVNDCFCVVSLGAPFKYVIPSFDVLEVEIRHMRVKGYNKDGEEESYDFFIRNDPSLCRVYPVWMEVTDMTLIQVCPLLSPALATIALALTPCMIIMAGIHYESHFVDILCRRKNSVFASIHQDWCYHLREYC
jgi:hypothetical protein